MQNITLHGRIEFCEQNNKQYNRTFTATLQKSGAFEYGNGTMVAIEWGAMANGRTPEEKLLDTRYCKIEKTPKGFESWLREWFSENYSEHVLTID